MGKSVKDMVEAINKHLEAMTEQMGIKLEEKQELKMALLVIERDLENSIPPNFKNAYENTGDWRDAAELVTAHILSGPQKYLTEYYAQTPALQKVIKTVDAETWTATLDEGEREDVLRDIDPNISEADIAVVQAKWNNPDISEEQVAAIRRQKGEGSYLARGLLAITGQTTAKRINDATKQ